MLSYWLQALAGYVFFLQLSQPSYPWIHKEYLIVHILIMYSLNYDIIGQFPTLNRRATEVPKEVLTFYLCQ